MSALDRPRLHFMGTMAVSTPTANNNNWDLVVEPQQATLYPKFLAMADDQFRQAMKTLVLLNLGIVHEGLVQVLEGNWNLYGDNSVVWRNAVVTGYDPPGGGRVTSGDPVIGQPVTIGGNLWGDTRGNPIIVDIDPTSDFASQMFVPYFAVGAGGAAGASLVAESNDQVAIPRTHSHWLDQFRNVAMFPDATFAATWQLALPNGALAITGSSSPALTALAAAAQAGLGLVVRFGTYFFNRKYTDPQLAQLFAQGQTVQNESAGVVLGTIAPWLPGEWGTVPVGRRLDPVATLQSPLPDMFVEVFNLAPATAALDATGAHVAMDLIAAFRDIIHPTPPNPDPTPDASAIQKLDVGPATLQVVAADGTVHDVGPVPYDQATYLAGGGIVEIPVPAGLGPTITSGTLQISAPQAPFAKGTAPGPLVAEVPLLAESDDRATYLTLGASTTITVNLRARGVAPGKPVAVAVAQYRSLEQLSPPPPDGTQPLPAKLTLPVPAQAEPVVTVSPQGGLTDAAGNLRLTLTGVDPGLCILLFTPDGAPPPPPDLSGFATAWTWLTFVHVRVLPSDADLDAIPDDQLTWDVVYDKVLRYYYKMYPTMDAHLPLDNQAACERAAQMLILLTDASAWNSTLYMPITREMSDGKRRLLHRWCQRVLNGQTT